MSVSKERMPHHGHIENLWRGAPGWLSWLVSIRLLVLTQVIISWVMKSSPKLGSVLSTESAWYSLSLLLPSLHTAPPPHSRELSFSLLYFKNLWREWLSDWASAFGSGHDPRVLESSSILGSLQGTCFSLCLCLLPLSVCLSWINK